MNDTKIVRTLAPVDFHGQSLTVIDREGKPYVAMRPVVEGIGLDWRSQHVKLSDDLGRWGMVMITTLQSADGKEREMACIPLKKLTGWLMTLQPSRMDNEVSARVLLYQNECDDALWDYWTQGVAENPRVAISNDPTALGLPDFRDPRKAALGWIEQYDRAEAEAAARKLLAAKIESDAPKVEFAERLEVAQEAILVGDMAKLITAQTGYKIGQNGLFDWLRSHRYVMKTPGRHLLPTQYAVESGWLVIKEGTRVAPSGNVHLTQTTRVTARGQAHFLGIFARLKEQAMEIGMARLN
jgi:phage antirepressor YoqD-like protein